MFPPTGYKCNASNDGHLSESPVPSSIWTRARGMTTAHAESSFAPCISVVSTGLGLCERALSWSVVRRGARFLSLDDYRPLMAPSVRTSITLSFGQVPITTVHPLFSGSFKRAQVKELKHCESGSPCVLPGGMTNSTTAYVRRPNGLIGLWLGCNSS